VARKRFSPRPSQKNGQTFQIEFEKVGRHGWNVAEVANRSRGDQRL
jgi:hypothetical protein